MKRVGKFLILALLLVPFYTYADGFLEDDLYYTLEYSSTTQAYVNGLRNSTATHITIPATVVYEYTEYDYRDDEWKIKRRTCTVTHIGGSAFSGCSSLASVTMPQCAIANPLYDSRFYCSGGVPIHRLGLDATVSAIHENAFCQCKSLTTIEVDADNEHYFVSPMDGCLYDINQTTLLCCPRDKTSITIPYGVTKIANYAFAYCSNLVSVTMPVTLTTIGENAFLDCASLPTAAIPDSVSSIGNGAFGNCRKLSGVTIPSGVKALSTSAFNNCDILWTEWYRTLADFAVNGRAYDLTQTPSDRAIADVSVSGDTALDAFVLKEGKVYDSVLYIHNSAGHSVRVTLPSMPQTSYQTFKGASPLTLPAYSTSILTITRVAGGNAGGNVFLVTRAELETIE